MTWRTLLPPILIAAFAMFLLWRSLRRGGEP